MFAYFGSGTGPSAAPDWFLDSDQASAEYGVSVASAGDMNGDGYSDVLVGASRYANGESLEGAAFVYTGSPDGPQDTPWWYAESNQTSARMGNSVAYAGDVNGDGYSDVLIGAYRFANPNEGGGAAFLWHGQAAKPSTGDPANADWVTVLPEDYAYWGYSVASAGDVNGDGYSDVIVGTGYYDGPAGDGIGIAGVWKGSGSGLPTSATWTASGNQDLCYFGHAVASAGDVNGDGFCDVMAGARYYDAGETDEGRVFLYYGNESRGLARTPEQWRSDLSSPLAPLAMTGTDNEFAIKARGRTPMGRGSVRIEYEVKPFGTAFDGTGTVLGDWADTGAPSSLGSVVALSEAVTGLAQMTMYHWRMRLHTDSPFSPRSPWFTLPCNGAGEMDLRTYSPTTDADETPLAILPLEGYPNPFNPQVTLAYTLASKTRVRLSVYDVSGRRLRTLVDGVQDAGRRLVAWDGRNDRNDAMPSGVYFARMQAGELTQSCKLILIR